jgi:hypothetical protein
VALSLWISHAEEWEANEKVSIDGVSKVIRVNDDVTSLDIRVDVYSAWVRWFERDQNAQFLPAMRFSGLDPIPGGFTGGTFFVTNGWKLYYNPNTVAVNGILYSDNFLTAYYTYEGVEVFPATVSALGIQASAASDGAAIADAVWANDGVVSAEDVATEVAAPSADTIAAQVWSQAIEAGLSAEEVTRIMFSVLTGKVSGAGTGTERFRDVADTKDRLVVTVDDDGNRSAVVRDGA